MNLKIIPALAAEACEKKYDAALWRKFARRITKNAFMAKALALRDAGVCAWCAGKIADAGEIHHTTYDHSCTFPGTIIVRQQTVQRHAKKREIPDCERCKADNQARFAGCLGKLVLVHKLCNIEISAHTAKAAGSAEK